MLSDVGREFAPRTSPRNKGHSIRFSGKLYDKLARDGFSLCVGHGLGWVVTLEVLICTMVSILKKRLKKRGCPFMPMG